MILNVGGWSAEDFSVFRERDFLGSKSISRSHSIILAAVAVFLGSASCALSDVTVGVLVHNTRQYIMFTADNTDDIDYQCTFRVVADYVDSQNKNIATREISLEKVIIKSKDALQLQSEQGKRIIEVLSAQFNSPAIERAKLEQKECDKNINYSGPGYNYVGRMKNGKRHGLGTTRYSNGTEETGTYTDAKRQSRFLIVKPDELSFTNKRNGFRFEGDFENDVRIRGRYQFNSGDTYDGSFVDDLFDGKGEYTWSTGWRYVGDWKRGKRSGVGRFFNKTMLVYDGNWKEDKYNGTGTYYSDGRKYVGPFVDGGFEGKGIEYYDNGNRMESEWKNNKREGPAVEYRKDDSIWKGTYKSGAIQAGGVTTLKFPESSALKICNRGSETVNAAIGYRYQDKWYASGWWDIESGGCKRPGFPVDRSSNVYVHVTTNTLGSGKSWVTKNDKAQFCVDTRNAFVISDSYCSEKYHPDLQFENFGALTWPGDGSSELVYEFKP